MEAETKKIYKTIWPIPRSGPSIDAYQINGFIVNLDMVLTQLEPQFILAVKGPERSRTFYEIYYVILIVTCLITSLDKKLNQSNQSISFTPRETLSFYIFYSTYIIL